LTESRRFVVHVAVTDQDHVDVVKGRLPTLHLFEQIRRGCVKRPFPGGFGERVGQDFLAARTKQEAAVGNVGDGEAGTLRLRRGWSNLGAAGGAHDRGHDHRSEIDRQSEQRAI
jgi:hypothetical protein